MFSHDVSGGLFTNYDVGTKNPEDPDNKLYSIMDQLEVSTVYLLTDKTLFELNHDNDIGNSIRDHAC